jgi:hypothetical protein
MNADAAESSALAEPKPPAEGWSVQRWILLIALVFAAHLAFIFLFGSKKIVVPRAVTNALQIQLVDAGNELVALTDPTLFVLPHTEDFLPAEWLRSPVVAQPEFRWTESPPFLANDTARLGATFNDFMRTNALATFVLDFKPEAQLAGNWVGMDDAPPRNSTLQVSGELSQRRMLNAISVPALPWNDVIAPSHVQVLVSPDGNIISVVLLQSSEYVDADKTALALARSVHFAPATGLMFGELIFNWHTVPAATP